MRAGVVLVLQTGSSQHFGSDAHLDHPHLDPDPDPDQTVLDGPHGAPVRAVAVQLP
jgi:hypothetical protein